MNINEKVSYLRYNKDTESHLNVNDDVCLRCKDKCCTYICPAQVYQWNEKKCIMNVRYENCLECGACKIACTQKNINWIYPNAGFGVKFKNG